MRETNEKSKQDTEWAAEWMAKLSETSADLAEATVKTCCQLAREANTEFSKLGTKGIAGVEESLLSLIGAVRRETKDATERWAQHRTQPTKSHKEKAQVVQAVG